ncbi:MAG: hypothetical protein Q4G05_01480 [Clostridia bacterium]|nr:hypothetical protein [Clostridia bacterium]
MFKIKGNYPYPILLEENIDYKTTTIKARYLYKSTTEGHKIKIECIIDNEEIKKLIEERKACYAIQIESPNVFYRKMFEFYDEEDINIVLKKDEVIDFIDIDIAILAKEDLNNFKNKDFIDLYKDIEMDIGKNEVLAVCRSVRQFITLKGEVLKEIHTIFNFQKDETIENIIYDPNYDRILVKIPKEIGDFYSRIKGNKSIIKIMNSLLLMPILTGLINDMNEAEEEFSSKLWFKTLMKKIDEITKREHKVKEELLQNSHETAQLIMQNITVDSIKELKTILENQEGDDD